MNLLVKQKNKMKKKEKYLYLANPRKSIKKIRKWQLKMIKKYNLSIINPFFEGQYTDKTIQNKFKNKIKLEPYEHLIIINNDINNIKNSNGVIAIVNGKTSYGTIMEMVYAALFKKNVYLICTNGNINHSWLFIHSLIQFKSFNEFETYVKQTKKLK